MTLHGPHVFVDIWTAMRPSLPPVTRSHSALLLANFTFPSPPSAADAALIRNRRRFCLLFFYEERRKERGCERSRKTLAIEHIIITFDRKRSFYATSTCTNARVQSNEGMLSHIPPCANPTNVPELFFSTISHLAFARPPRVPKIERSEWPSRKTKSSSKTKTRKFIQKDSPKAQRKSSSSSSCVFVDCLTFFCSFVRPMTTKKRSASSMSLLLCARACFFF